MRALSPITALLLLALAACGGGDGDGGGGGDPAPPMHPAWRRTRLAAADAEAPRIELLDVELGGAAGEVTLAQPAAALEVSSSGEHLLASRDGGADVIYAGVSLLDHSEGATDADEPHIHVYKFPPRAVAYPLAGAGRPRLAAHADRFALLFPGDGAQPAEALRFAEAALLEDAPPPPARWTLPAPPPAAAFPLADQVLLAGPDGVVAVAEGGAPRALAPACGDEPAAARAAGRVAFACDAGLLVVEASGADLLVTELPYPAGASRPAALAGHVERPILLAHGAASLLRYDLAAGGPPAELSLPAEPCALGLEPAHARTITLLAADGAVYQLDADDGAVLARREVVAPFSCAAPLRPRLAQAPTRAYVSDPAARVVHELRLDDGLAPLATFPLAGVPSALAVAGVGEETRNLGDLSDL